MGGLSSTSSFVLFLISSIESSHNDIPPSSSSFWNKNEAIGLCAVGGGGATWGDGGLGGVGK